VSVRNGTTAQCLDYYLSRVGEEYGTQLIASFTGAIENTVREWVAGRLPGGAYLLRLRYFLDFVGCTPSELSSLEAVVKEFGRLIAFRAVSEEQALVLTGFSNSSQLQRVLLRGAGTSSQRLRAMKDAVKANKDKLKEQREYFVRYERFPSPKQKSIAELYGAKVASDKYGEPSGKLILTGTIEECFYHLVTDGKANELHLRDLTAWVGAVWHPTGRSWALGQKFPKGMNLLKLAYYLEQVGFGVKELQALDPDVRLFGRMMAFGLLDLNGALQLLGFAGSYGDVVLSAILRGKALQSGPRRLLKTYVDSHMTDLAAAVGGFPDAVPTLPSSITDITDGKPPPTGAAVSVSPPAPEAPMPEPVSVEDDLEHRALITVAAHQIGALIPLMEALASDRFSKEERALLRELAGKANKGGVFRLYQLAEALTSEASRRQAKKGD